MPHKALAVLFTLTFCMSVVSAQTPSDPLWQKALKIQREAIVVDTHADTPSLILDGGLDIGDPNAKSHLNLQRMKEAGVSAEFFVSYISKVYAPDNRSAFRAIEMIDAIRHDIVERYPNDFVFATSVADIRAAKNKARSPRSSASKVATPSKTVCACCASFTGWADGT